MTTGLRISCMRSLYLACSAAALLLLATTSARAASLDDLKNDADALKGAADTGAAAPAAAPGDAAAPSDDTMGRMKNAAGVGAGAGAGEMMHGG